MKNLDGNQNTVRQASDLIHEGTLALLKLAGYKMAQIALHGIGLNEDEQNEMAKEIIEGILEQHGVSESLRGAKPQDAFDKVTTIALADALRMREKLAAQKAADPNLAVNASEVSQ